MEQQFRLGLTLAAVVGGALGWGVSPAPAQEKKEAWEILLAYDTKEKPTYSKIALRPNVEQSVFVYLKNAGTAAKKNLSVTLARVSGAGKPQVLGQTTLDKIAVNQIELLKFKPAAPPKAEPKPDSAPSMDFPFHLQIWLQQEGKTEVKKIDVPVSIQQPHEYVDARASYDRGSNRVTVTVDTKRENANPKCEVNLVLLREVIPTLLPAKKALLKEDLTAENLSKQLFADLLFPQGIPPKSGRVYVTIDGFDRAYMFQGSFETGNMPPLALKNRVRLLAPRYFNPQADPKNADKLPVLLEVDGLLEQDARIEVGFDRAGNGKHVTEKVFPSLRQQSLSLKVEDEGEVRCKTAVKEWTLVLPTAGVEGGLHSLRVRIVNAKGQPLQLADEEELPLYSKNPVVNPHAPMSFEDKAVYAEVIFDFAPEGLRFVDLKKQVKPGETVALNAAVKHDPLNQSPIKVRFSVGDGKEPPLEAKFDPGLKLWHADLVVPTDAKGKLAVKVEAITATGLAAAPQTDTLLVGAATTGDAETGDIKGVVKWNGIAQPGAKVQLKDAKDPKGAALKSMDTKAGGAFAFTKVPPGKYALVVTKSGFETSSTNVAVLKGETTEENVVLKKRR